MEGYSVTEAASVLGVPTERVWELLARGVLSGAPDGETGMRVFLQPRPAPSPPEPSPAKNGGSHEAERGELSPFRELLTEFRSLTERYGQALLALGEARGEVASLRSRVDLLEARMDLRLPSGTAAAAAGWEPSMPSPARSPMPTTPAAVPSAAPATEAVREPAPDQQPLSAASVSTGGNSGSRDTRSLAELVEEEPIPPEIEARAARRSGSRHAIEYFAEALARADDPSIPELPGGTDAIGVTGRNASAEELEDALPREVAIADEVPVADEAVQTPASEPHDDPVAPSAVESSGAVAAQADAEPLQTAAPVPPPASDEVAAEEPPNEAIPGGAEPDQPVLHEPVAADATEPPRPAEPDAPAWQDERYTAEITEPDWFEGEAFESSSATAEPASVDRVDGVELGTAALGETDDTVVPLEPEPIAAARDPQADEPQAEAATAAEPEPAAPDDVIGDVAAPDPLTEADAPAPSGTPSHSLLGRLRPAASVQPEETVLWFGRQPAETSAADVPGGADEMEVAPSGGAGPVELESPGAAAQAPRDFEDALAALDALSRSAPGTTTSATQLDARRTAPAVRHAPNTPATRAYRRLRRIFPG